MTLQKQQMPRVHDHLTAIVPPGAPLGGRPDRVGAR
jgi:hypothetical protein